MFDFVRMHPVSSVTHIIRDGRCIDCQDTLEWFQRSGESYVMEENMRKR